jgi:hypothetical protein
MAREKNKSRLRRLLPDGGADQQKPTYICQTSDEDPDHYYRWKMVNGNLEAVDGFPYDSYESCMGIARPDDEQG